MLVEHVGAESLIAVRLVEAKTAHLDEGDVRDEVMVTMPGYSNLQPGQRVGLGVDLGEAVVFRGADGRRVDAAL
jgi:multiple sugar transport system ATP-binding protein